MDAQVQLFLVCLLLGLALIGAEIFLPGGFIGFLGALALIGAMVTGFVAFGPQWGFLISVLIVLLSGACVVFWIRLFPRTPLGRRLTLAADGRNLKSADDLHALVGQSGVAESALRPAGIARLGGRRLDVVADGSWIPAGAAVRVTAVEGNRIVVREAAAPGEPAP